MPEIQGGRWDNFLRRLFNVKGPAIAPGVGPEIYPHVDADPNHAMSDYLRNERIGGMGGSLAGGAGLKQYFEINNPEGSQSLVEITDIWARDATAATTWFITVGTDTATGTPQGSQGLRDTRWSRSGIYNEPFVAAFYAANIAAVFGARIFQYYTAAANNFMEYHNPVILHPGHSAYVWIDSLQHTGYYTVNWRERPAESSEIE